MATTETLQTRRFKPGTRYYVLLLILITVLPVVGLILYNDFDDRQQARKQGRNQAMEILRAIHLKQQNVIESTGQVLTALGQLPAVRGYDRAGCVPLLNSILGQYRRFLSLSAFKPNGDLFCSAPGEHQSINIAGHSYFREALESKQLTSSNYTVSDVLGEPSLLVIKPVLNDKGEVLTLVKAAINLSWLQEQVRQLPLYDDSVITIFDANGTILMQYPPQAGVKMGNTFAQTEVVKTVVRLRHLGVLERSNPTGSKYLYAFGPLGGDDVNTFVTVSIPADVILANANDRLREHLILLTAVTALSVLIAFSWSHRYFVSPIRRLAEAATQVRHGKLNTNLRQTNGPKELVQLGTTFNQMTEALERRVNDKERIEHALSRLIQQHRNTTPTEFLVSLTSILADSLEAKYCFIGLLSPTDRNIVETRVFWGNGRQRDNRAFDITTTIHKELISQERFRIYRDNARQLFPNDALLNELEIEGFAGITLTDFDQKVRGVLVVMNDQPMRNDEMCHSLLQIFGARVTAELEREETEQQRQQLLHDARLTATAFESHEGMFITDIRHRILRVNRAFEEHTGYKEDSVLGKQPDILFSNEHSADFIERIWNEATENKKWSGEVNLKCNNGRAFTANLTLSAVVPTTGDITHFVAHFQDITERKLAEARIQHLAYHDDLTELPNRSLLLERLERSLTRLKRRNKFGALMFIDLDHFKNINDSLGHPVGDGLLIDVAERLRNNLRQEDTVARLGGDEFVVLLPELNDDKDHSAREAHALATKLSTILSDKYNIAGHSIKTGVSIGIVPFPGQDLSADDILRHADMAMYNAKGDGRGTIRVFEPEMQARLIERLKIEAELRHAYEKKQFVLYLQPQVTVDENAIIGCETLLRWQHPENGLTAPGAFISVLEESGLIQPVGKWVLTQACATLAENRTLADHINRPVIAVNISPRQFLEHDFVTNVINLLDEFGIDGERLELEITERAIVKDVEKTIHKMKQLREYGVRFSIDDFGTGYSSMAYIKRLPIDTLKIDRGFIQDCLTDANDQAIVRAIASMADSLELNLIAEGVETAEQLEFLRQIGCHAYQGFYFSRPLPEVEFGRLLKQSEQQA